MARIEENEERIWLAWDGWRMRVPADWRPHQIDCLLARREMLIGPAGHAAVKVQWWRPSGRQRDGLPSSRPRRSPGDGDGEPFTDIQAAGEVTGAGKSFWYGYAAGANLVVQVTSDRRDGRDVDPVVREMLLPSLSATAADVPTRWSAASASFVSPAGFTHAAHRLEAGHVALRWACGRQRLIVRQIYPAALALARRQLPRWLGPRSFPERRRWLPIGEPIPWSVPVGDRELAGLLQPAVKRFGEPFGRFGVRRAVSAAVVDERLDRILMAEIDSPGDPDDRVLCDVLAGMNWAMDAAV